MYSELPWAHDAQIGSIPTHGQPAPDLTKALIAAKAFAVNKEDQRVALPLIDACQRRKGWIICSASSDERGIGQQIWTVVVKRAEGREIRTVLLDDLINRLHGK
jgi:hypothetical protein